MKEQLISFQTAVLAKNNHVEIESYEFYTHRGDLCKDLNFNNQSQYDGSYGVYTQSLLQKWFRHSKNVHIVLYPKTFGNNNLCLCDCSIYVVCKNENKCYPLNIECSYEEALEKGLQEAFKYINK